ncbi:Predicted membrane protein [Mannheimia haemolytica]|nr:Predicted membrane protein [Mannheimia haemolytica]
MSFFNYDKIYQVNIAEGKADEKILVIDLHSGRRLLAYVENAEDLQPVVDFFGGYKKESEQK